MGLKNLVISGLAGISLLGCAIADRGAVQQKPAYYQSGYDNSSAKVSDQSIEHILNSTYKVLVKIDYEASYCDMAGKEVRKEEVTMHIAGSAVGIYKDLKRVYFVTCNHVTDGDGDEVIFDKDSQLFIFFRQKNTRMAVEGANGREFALEELCESSSTDISLVATAQQDDFSKYDTFSEMGDYGKLKPGDFAYTSGFPLDLNKQVTGGIITALGDDGAIYSSACLNPGNSGGGLFVIENGQPKLVGFGQSYRRDGRGIYKYVGIGRMEKLVRDNGYGFMLKDSTPDKKIKKSRIIPSLKAGL